MFSDSWNVISEGFVKTTSEWSWLYFITYILLISQLVRSLLQAVVLDVFLATLEVNRLRQRGHKSAIEHRIESLRETEGGEIFTKLSGEKRSWRVVQSPFVSHFRVLESIFQEELNEEIDRHNDKLIESVIERRENYTTATTQFNVGRHDSLTQIIIK